MTEKKKLINPLIPLEVIPPYKETEDKVALMQGIDSIASLNKQMLAVKRERAQLEIQNRGLDEAIKLINGMAAMTDIILSEEVMEKVKKSIETTKDVKELAVAYGIFADKLTQLQGQNVLEDLGGGKKKMKVSVAFQNDSGERTGVQVEL